MRGIISISWGCICSSGVQSSGGRAPDMGQFLPVNQLVGTTINHRQSGPSDCPLVISPARSRWQGASIRSRPGGILVNGNNDVVLQRRLARWCASVYQAGHYLTLDLADSGSRQDALPWLPGRARSPQYERNARSWASLCWLGWKPGGIWKSGA